MPGTLQQQARRLNVSLTDDQSVRLLAYLGLIQRWNRVYNLTTVDDPSEGLTRHLLDCLAIGPHLERLLGATRTSAPRLLDAGSGAGLPGIPLAICHPSWHLTLVDAVQKKVAFQRQAAVELSLSNVDSSHARLESLQIPPCDLIVSRAFASLADFTRLTRHLLKPGGVWVAMKGKYPADEIAALPAETMLHETITLRVPDLDEDRHLIVLAAQSAPA